MEATAVSLVPFRNPVNNYDTALQRAALARQIFVTGPPPTLSDSLLPLAMIGLDRNEIQWIDMYLVRRDSGPETSGVRLGLADPATGQAYLMQYDAQLQANPLSFAASDNFQALPPAGRFPLAGIDTASLTQTFFPQQMAVELSIIPADELPAVLEDSMSLPPIDLLQQPASALANFTVYALIAVPRNNFAGLQKTLPPSPLKPALAQGVGRLPILRPIGPIRPTVTIPTLGSTSSSAWAAAIAGQTYGFYVLRRSEPIFVELTNPAASPAIATATSTTTAPAPPAPPVPVPLGTIGPLVRTLKAPAATTAAPKTSPAPPVPAPPGAIGPLVRTLKAPATTAAAPKTSPARAGRKPRT